MTSALPFFTNHNHPPCLANDNHTSTILRTGYEGAESDREGADAQQQLEPQDVISQDVELDLHDFCGKERNKNTHTNKTR